MTQTSTSSAEHPAASLGIRQRALPLGDTVQVAGSGRRTVRLVNDDTMPHQIAMFRVPVGTTASYRVPPGVYGGMCSAHPSKRPITFIAR
jgi:hypothetical protein